jgi:phytanoyl-CoA hydroxylase
MNLSNIKAEFEQNGFVILRAFVDSQYCDRILEIAQTHLKYEIKPLEFEGEYIGRDELNSSVRRLRQVYDRDIVFKEWMEYPQIRPILKELIGDEISLVLAHHNSIMTKLPHKSTQTSWHQDIRYWNYTNDNLISVWLALDNEDSNNGVLEFIPHSHKMNFDKSQFEDKDYFSTTNPKNKNLIDTKTSNTLHKGDVLIFHSKLLHRANKNNTDKAKISFVYTIKSQNNIALSNTRSSKYREIILK